MFERNEQNEKDITNLNGNASIKRIFRENTGLIQKIIIAGIMMIIFVVLSFASDNFLTVANLLNVARQTAMVMIAGSAVTLLMISGNFDLSIGSVLALTGVIAAKLFLAGWPLLISFLIAIICGTLLGLINGLLVVNLRIPSIIATLGMMYAARGTALVLGGNSAISEAVPKAFFVMGRGFWGPIPIAIAMTIIFLAVFYFIETKTVLGRYVFAIGSNRTTAILSGINANRVTLLLYLLVGTLTGIAGILMASRLGTGSPTVAVGFEFDVIVAVLLGGTSLFGGEGSIIGMVIGAFLIGILRNGLNLLGIQSFYQQIFMGAILVGAVLLNRVLKERIK